MDCALHVSLNCTMNVPALGVCVIVVLPPASPESHVAPVTRASRKDSQQGLEHNSQIATCVAQKAIVHVTVGA